MLANKPAPVDKDFRCHLMPPTICPLCGKAHDGIPDLAFRRPDAIVALAAAARAAANESDDACIIPAPAGGLDAAHTPALYFIRAVLIIPLIRPRTLDSAAANQADFALGPWAQVAPADYKAITRQKPGKAMPRVEALLANAVPRFPNSLGQRVWLDPGDGTSRPLLVCRSRTHPLALAQHRGMTERQAMKLVHALL